MRTIKKILSILSVPFLFIKKWIIQRLLNLRARLQISSLREAIQGADKDKQHTGRKNMVVFNSTAGKYEPVQKKLLKIASNNTKNKNNKAMTPGRIRVMKKQKPRVFDPERVKQIENKSLYVTQ